MPNPLFGHSLGSGLGYNGYMLRVQKRVSVGVAVQNEVRARVRAMGFD